MRTSEVPEEFSQQTSDPLRTWLSDAAFRLHLLDNVTRSFGGVGQEEHVEDLPFQVPISPLQ